MNGIVFATSGTVHDIKTMNGTTDFILDPCCPYRLDCTQLGDSLYTLLVRQDLVFGSQIILPDNSVGIIDYHGL